MKSHRIAQWPGVPLAKSPKIRGRQSRGATLRTIAPRWPRRSRAVDIVPRRSSPRPDRSGPPALVAAQFRMPPLERCTTRGHIPGIRRSAPPHDHDGRVRGPCSGASSGAVVDNAKATADRQPRVPRLTLPATPLIEKRIDAGIASASPPPASPVASPNAGLPPRQWARTCWRHPPGLRIRVRPMVRTAWPSPRVRP